MDSCSSVMAVGRDNAWAVELPAGLWEIALESLKKVKAREREEGEELTQTKTKTRKNTKKNKKKKPRGASLIHFTYSLKDRKWLKWNISQCSNLFFEYAAATQEDVPYEYIVVQMDDEDSLEGGEETSTRNYFSYDVDPLRETILRNGILVDPIQDENSIGSIDSKILFHFLGCSNSQVQRHCYIFRRSSDLAGNQNRILEVLPDLLQLEKKKGIPKRVKYTGLLFSGVQAVQLPTSNLIVEEIDKQYKRNGYDFADGPGLISRKLAIYVKEQLGLGGGGRCCPSIFQIRYCGLVARSSGRKEGFVCKGVVIVDPTDDETYTIRVRPSMLKIQASPEACSVLQYTLGICDHSHKPCPGRLGQQMVCLLSGTVERRDLIKLQGEHLKAVEKALQDPVQMAWVLALDKRQSVWQNFHKLLMAEMDGSKSNQHGSLEEVPRLYQKCVEAVKSNCDRLASPKVQLPLAASRTLFGAVIPELLHDVLGEGDCIVLLEDGPLRPQAPSDESYVIVSRSPSYFPGDIRVLRNVQLPDTHPINTLRNCILFSTRGNRPDPDKMGGGDLDGDKYLVVWHPLLLKYATTLRNIQPASYDDSPQGNVQSLAPKGDWIHYAAQTDNAMLGAVENTFYKLAKQEGVKSIQISELNTLFASLVDRHPTSLEAFEKLKGSLLGEALPECVWEEMSAKQKECADNQNKALQSGDLQHPYMDFQKACTRWARNPKQLARKFLKDFGYHFHAALRSADVVNTVAELDGRSCNGVHQLPVDDVPEDDISDRVLEPREINAAERNKLLQFENRLQRLFEKPIGETAKLVRLLQHDIDQHESRKGSLCKAKDRVLALLQEQDQELESRRSQVAHNHNAWSKSRIRHWQSLSAEKETTTVTKLSEAKAKKEQFRQWLATLQNSLDSVNDELGKMWFFSPGKTDAVERKKLIQTDIHNLRREYDLLECRIQAENHLLQADLRQLEVDAKVEREAEEKRVINKLSELDFERGKIDLERNACCDRYDPLIDGSEKKRVKALVKAKKLEVQSLREQQRTLVGHDDNQIQYITSQTIDNLILMVELRQLEEQAESMFCPVTLAKTIDFITETNQKLESLNMGRGHVLHRIEQAKLRWTRRLQSGTMTSAQERKEWNDLVKRLERVLNLEKNRLLGFPREGVRNGPMPVYQKRSLLRDLMRNSQALVITAGTGCGKSTQIPQYVADDFYSYRQDIGGSSKLDAPVRICCTQPRRVAAQKLATRVAEEYDTKLGDLVGFQVGSRGRSLDECVKTSSNTVIEFVTEGLLLHNLAKSTGFLEKYDCVIIDEMHERNAEQDLCLCLLRDYLSESKVSRPSFRVVVMSASINADKFSKYLSNCASLYCPGRNYPVQENYVPPEAPAGGMDDITSHAVKVLFDQIVSSKKEMEGDVLIFLSGSLEIENCVRKIRQRAEENSDLVVAYPLYSRLDQDSISAATNPKHRVGLESEMTVLLKRTKSSPDEIRKVIVATNIAETSLTIDGVRFVIDSGLAKKLRYDHSLRCSVLGEDAVSHASTIQRKGRAGRTSSGSCYYMYTENHHQEVMSKYDTPQILERSVDELILLSLSVCGRSVEEMGLLDAPKSEDVNSAKERLFDLGFLEESKTKRLSLTNDGQVASSLSFLRPGSVRMILNAREKFPQSTHKAINLAVLMSTTDSIFDRRREVHEEDKKNNALGDHLLSLEHLEWFEDAFKTTKKKSLKKKCTERGINFKLLKCLQEDVEMCHRKLKEKKLFPSLGVGGVGGEDDSLLKILISGYFHHIVQCIEPELIRDAGCSHLSIPELSVSLDRQSFLTSYLASSERQATHIDDDNNNNTETTKDVEMTGFDNGTGDDWNPSIAEEEVKPRFLVCGDLRKVKSISKTFMMSASVVDGDWIAEAAPDRWLNRTSFTSWKENLCSITIKNIGPSILSACMKRGDVAGQDFFEQMKCQSGVDLLVASMEGCFVRISGTQSRVCWAKARIEKELKLVMRNKDKGDREHNGVTGLLLGSGMKVIEQRRQGRGPGRPLHEIVRAFGTNDGKHSACRNVVSVRIDKKKSSVVAVPVRATSIDAVRASFNAVSDFKFKLRKDRDKFTVDFRPESLGGRSSSWLANAQKVESILIQHNALTAETLDGNYFPNGDLFLALGQEAFKTSQFWQSFQKQLGAQRKNTICFVPSENCFVFGPKGKESKSWATKFESTVNNLCNQLTYHDVEIPTGFERHQIRRFCSVLDELRKHLSSTLFYLAEVKTLSDVTITKPTCGSTCDYSWLTETINPKDLRSIRVCFAAVAPTNKEKKNVKSILGEKLSGEAIAMSEDLSIPSFAPKGSEWKQCVMCRRDVLVVSFRKDNESSKAGKQEEDYVEGFNLTLCGCTYCRECFRHGALQRLKDQHLRSTVKCLRCERIVLAKDCFEIVGRKTKKRQQEEEYSTNFHVKEWNELCNLAEAKYCQENQTLVTDGMRAGKVHDRLRGWATCPDCGTSAVFPKGHRFFICRNQKCESKMCTRCRQVVTSQEAVQQCIVSKCKSTLEEEE